MTNIINPSLVSNSPLHKEIGNYLLAVQALEHNLEILIKTFFVLASESLRQISTFDPQLEPKNDLASIDDLPLNQKKTLLKGFLGKKHSIIISLDEITDNRNSILHSTYLREIINSVNDANTKNFKERLLQQTDKIQELCNLIVDEHTSIKVFEEIRKKI